MLETEFETAEGAVRVVDFTPPRADGPPRLMRIVEGLRGRVRMRLEVSIRREVDASVLNIPLVGFLPGSGREQAV